MKLLSVYLINELQMGSVVFEEEYCDSYPDTSTMSLPPWLYRFSSLALGPTHTTSRGDRPHGPSLGPPSKHTVPPGVDLARPVFLKSMPLFLESFHANWREL